KCNRDCQTCCVSLSISGFSHPVLTEWATLAMVCKIPRTGFSESERWHTGPTASLAGCIRSRGRPAWAIAFRSQGGDESHADPDPPGCWTTSRLGPRADHPQV